MWLSKVESSHHNAHRWLTAAIRRSIFLARLPTAAAVRRQGHSGRVALRSRAGVAIKQARGDMIEATCPRLPHDPAPLRRNTAD